MSRIKSIGFRYGRKFNLGDYESVDVEVYLSSEVDPDEDMDGVAEFLAIKAKEIVKDAVMPILKASEHQINKPRITHKIMGKKVEPAKNPQFNLSSDSEFEDDGAIFEDEITQTVINF